MENYFTNKIWKIMSIYQILVLTHEKDNNLSKEKNICREGSAESLPIYTS